MARPGAAGGATRSQRLRAFEEAERLAERLVRVDLSRSEVSPVLNLLVHGNGDFGQRKEQARELLRRAPTSGLANRGGDMGARLLKLTKALDPVLARERPEAELRWILGWLQRLLFVRDRQKQAKHNGQGNTRP